MDDHITYRDDFYGWSRRQAAVLRGMAARSDLPNDLDLEHVAEEIEDVGNEQRNAVQSHIRLIFVHMLKAASVERQELRAGWYAEIVNFHNEILGRSSNSMRQDIDVALLWRRAFKQARLDLRSRGEDLLVHSGSECPFVLDDLLDEEFDAEAALERVVALRPDAE
jgi:hypothetical protein